MPEPPAAPAPQRHLKPGGWLFLILVVATALSLGWTELAPRLAAWWQGSPLAPGAPAPATPPAGPPSPKAGPTLAPALFPRPATALPRAESGALANVVLPPLVGVTLPPAGATGAPSEVEAIRAVARGDADATIVSVAALAAVPEAVAAGVRAAWLVGPSPADGALFPSCDGAELRQLKLGAVPGSLGEFHLFAALAGAALPPLTAFARDADLERAMDEGVVTAGPARGRARQGLVGRPGCAVLPLDAFSLVAVRNTHRPMTAGALAALVGLARAPAPTPGEVAAFFDPHRQAPGGFAELFHSAGEVWRAAGVVRHPARAPAAIDRTFLDRRAAPPAAAPAAPPPGPPVATRELGFPSWIDR